MSTTPVKIPAALSMLLKSFGVDPEKISVVLNVISEKAFEHANNGTIDKIFGVLETLERIESKLDSLIQIEMERKQNGKPESGT